MKTGRINLGVVPILILLILLLLQSSPAQAAPPTWQASSNIAASTGADVTVTLPTHAAGDILLLQVVVRDTNDTITWPAGWAQIATVDRGAATARYWWAWKRAASAAETNPLVGKSTTTGDTYAAVTTYRGALGSDPWDVIGTPNTATTAAHTLNGITTTTADTLIIASLCGEDNTAGTGTTFSATSPASLTQVLYDESNAGADGACTAGAAAKAATGATGNATATWTATVVGSGGIVLALKPAVASQLAFAQQPTNATAGATITPAVTVQIQDLDGNLVATATNTVTLAIGSNPGSGTLGGTTSVAAVGGVATFSDLSINNAGAGYTLTASATGLTGATSGTFNITAPVTLTTSAVKDLTCAGYRDGSQLNCTAGEFTISAIFSAAPGTPPMCVAGQPFNFKVDLRLYGSNADRYDIGFFAGQQGNDPALTTAGNICSVATFPETPSPWLDLDAPTQPTDTCGDYLGGGDSTITVDEIKVVCAGDSTGALMVPYVLTYWQNTGNICTGPSDIVGGSTSKCNKGTSTVSGAVSVFSGAYIDVTKQTSPDGDSQSFSFTATGPSGSKVIALTGATSWNPVTGGAYTPATIAAATNSTTVTLTDGQTARFYINALSTNQTLTITETAVTNWESTASISCSAVTGSPTLTTDNANRTMSAVLNSTDSAAACTITNTKRSRTTLTKSVGGRLDSADQFTVSASGGGTLTGTTSATTSGAGTSASTTFYSTPNTALTLTDAKASGPTALTSYETRLTCTNAFTGPGATPDASLPNNMSTASASITPAPGDDIACTYTNTPKPTLTKAFSPTTIGVGQTSTLTFTISNPAGGPARTGGLTFTDTFPTNLVIAATPNVVNNCGGSPTITATAGSGTFTVGGTGVNAAAGPSTCTISVDATSSAVSSYINGSGEITSISDSLINGVTNQTLDVAQASLNKAFSPTTVDQGDTSALTFTLTNGSGNPAQSGINFTDTLPANVTVAGTPNITTTCPSGTGVVAATASSGSIAVTGAAMSNSQASCVITVDVTSNTPGGPYDNTSANISGTARLTNSVTTSGLTVQAKPTMTKAFSPTTIGVGLTSTLTFTISNPAGAPIRSGLTFTDAFPANLVIAGTPNVVNNCGGTPTITATAGSGTFTVGGTGVNAAAGSSTCTISVDVTSTVPLSGYVNGAAQITAISGLLLNGVTDQTLNVEMPSLTIVKAVIAYSDPVNDITNPKAIPGSVMTYTVLVTNSGAGTVDTGTTVITDPIPANTELFVGDINGACSGPVKFTDGSTASGLSYTFGDGAPCDVNDLAVATDSISFSDDSAPGPYVYDYNPVPVANYDANITSIKISLNGTFAASDGTNNPSFDVKFRVRVK